MSTQKTCKQCGEIKPLAEFRPYYNGRKGTYTTCRSCEKINTRFKYLTNKSLGKQLTPEEQNELEQIKNLWDVQRRLGLQPPRIGAGRKVSVTAELTGMLDKYNNQYKSAMQTIEEVQTVADVPEDLSRWLTAPLTEEPEYYQEEIYDKLKAVYRPQVGLNPATHLPVFDETYLPILNKILERFDAYEDEYYSK